MHHNGGAILMENVKTMSIRQRNLDNLIPPGRRSFGLYLDAIRYVHMLFLENTE